jgi:Zn-dependent protease with chaperone function
MRFSIVIFILVLFISSCGEEGMVSYVSTDIDKMIGEKVKEQIENNPNQFRILDGDDYPKAYERLNHIKIEILNSGFVKHKNDFTWELKIVDDTSVLNAFCVPGGYIYVYTGLIKYLDSEDQLAGVMGHEIAHADLRHSTRQLIQNYGISLLIKFIFGYDGGGLINIAANLAGLKFSRSHESEADIQSVKYLYHTPYDARGVKGFFEKLNKENKNPQIVEFLSTHPEPDNRIQKIDDEFKLSGGKKGKMFTKEYIELKRSLN